MVSEKIVGSEQNVTIPYKCTIGTCIPNYSLISQKLPELSHVFTFGWIGRLGRSVYVHFPESVIIKGACPKVLPCRISRQLLKPFLRYPIFMIFQENLYESKIWLVRPFQMISGELFSYWVSPYQVSSSSNQKCGSYSIFKILL